MTVSNREEQREQDRAKLDEFGSPIDSSEFGPVMAFSSDAIDAMLDWLTGVRAEAAAGQREKDAQIAEGYAEPIHPHHSMEKATARYVASLIRNPVSLVTPEETEQDK